MSVRTRLTPADSAKVFRAADTTWLHYFHRDGYWLVAPCDPRRNPGLTNIHRASGQVDGVITRSSGFEEVP